jgi:predicted nuclease of predicted toxin-antitoxin system
MIRLLFDENFNQRIVRGLKLELPKLESEIAQNCGLKGEPDPKVLEWASENGYVLVTHDLKTVPKFAYERVTEKRILLGVIAVPDDLPIGQAIDELALTVVCSLPDELENRVLYLPL